ncbi:hypothetical protein IV102_03165 [bacterium]|nr:hypothetical protein [bacterium]
MKTLKGLIEDPTISLTMLERLALDGSSHGVYQMSEDSPTASIASKGANQVMQANELSCAWGTLCHTPGHSTR